MTQPCVDVIILSWDRVPDTLQAIESASSQDGVDVRVLVVDQGSRPDQLQELQRALAGRPEVVLHCNTHNSGVAEGRNQASALGRAEFVAALDNDAVFADQHQLARAVAIMRSNPDLDALAFRIVLFDRNEDDRSSWSYPEPIESCGGTPFLTSRFVGAGHMLRRAAFQRAGGYDPHLFFLHEELDLSYRLINAGGMILYTPDVVVRHKVSGERRVWTSQRHVLDVRNSLYLMAKYRFSKFSGCLAAARKLIRTARDGHPGSALRGTWLAMPMLRHAIRLRLSDPAVCIRDDVRTWLKQLERGAALRACEPGYGTCIRHNTAREGLTT
jgi:GT2 family glycosyltransferase